MLHSRYQATQIIENYLSLLQQYTYVLYTELSNDVH